jgi:hypothetical protein
LEPALSAVKRFSNTTGDPFQKVFFSSWYLLYSFLGSGTSSNTIEEGDWVLVKDITGIRYPARIVEIGSTILGEATS